MDRSAVEARILDCHRRSVSERFRQSEDRAVRKRRDRVEEPSISAPKGCVPHQERHGDERRDTSGQERLQVSGSLRQRLDVVRRHVLDDDRPLALNHRPHEVREISIGRQLLEERAGAPPGQGPRTRLSVG